MEDLKDFLRSIGFSKNESEVYLALVKRGTSSVLEISRDTQIHRANIYPSLSKLTENGLIFELEKDGKKVFYARDPESLLEYQKNREVELKTTIEKLRLLHPAHSENSSVRMTEGKFAVRNAYLGILNSSEEILSYGTPSKAFDLVVSIFDEFHKERIKKKIVMKHIYNTDCIERAKYLQSLSYTEIKHLPSKYDSYVTTLICKKKVILIVWTDKLPVIEIENEEVVKAYRSYFEVLWNSSEDV